MGLMMETINYLVKKEPIELFDTDRFINILN